MSSFDFDVIGDAPRLPAQPAQKVPLEKPPAEKPRTEESPAPACEKASDRAA